MKEESLRVKKWVESQSKVCACGNKMYYKSTTCKDCAKNLKVMEKIKNMTIGEYRAKILSRGNHASWLHAEVRNFSRNWNKELRSLPCARCGYKLHVELCHIKPLTAFSDDTLLSVVNSEENLLVLCRNCHWEFDNGILKIEEVQRK